jgi:hypothetical protein
MNSRPNMSLSRRALVSMLQEACWVSTTEAEQALDMSDGTFAGAQKYIVSKRSRQNKEKVQG